MQRALKSSFRDRVSNFVDRCRAEDGCYVGGAPGLLLGGCHGDDERAVFEELCKIVDETIRLYLKQGAATVSGHLGARFRQPPAERGLATPRSAP